MENYTGARHTDPHGVTIASARSSVNGGAGRGCDRPNACRLRSTPGEDSRDDGTTMTLRHLLDEPPEPEREPRRRGSIGMIGDIVLLLVLR